MQYRNLGGSGLKVSTISLGSWLTFGNTVNQSGTNEIVWSALDAGINLFDTADIYARGAAEESLGKALQGQRRDHLVLATKCFWPMTDSPNDRGLSRKHIFESCHASLRRLGTDYIDLFQCHRFDDETPLEETIRAMGDLIAEGKILYWGTSMWSAEQMRQTCMLSEKLNRPKPISEQPRYNLLHREIESEVIPECQRLGVGLIVWSPLAQGFLTGKYSRGNPSPEGTRGADSEASKFLQEDLQDERCFDIVEAFTEAAADRMLPLPLSKLALAWCLRKRQVASAIVGASRAAQVNQNVSASDVEWTLEMEKATRDILERVDIHGTRPSFSA